MSGGKDKVTTGDGRDDSSARGIDKSGVRKYVNRRYLLFISFTVLIFTCVFIFTTFIYDSDDEIDNISYNTACTVDNEIMLAQATGYVDNGDNESLSRVAEYITDTQGYRYDQNCLAILVFNQVNQGNLDLAEEYIVSIDSIYESAVDKDADYMYTSNPEKLRVYIQGIRDNRIKSEEDNNRLNQGSSVE